MSDNPATKQALKRIAELASGNGLSESDVSLVNTEEEKFEFSGVLSLQLKPEISEQRINGKSGKNPSTGRGEMQQDIREAQEKFWQDDAVTNRILQKIAAQPGQGWGYDDHDLPIDKKQEFSFTEACGGCQGQGQMACRTCAGQGHVNCLQCQAQGKIRCHLCRGAGHTLQNNQQQPCNPCRNTGFVICTKCQGQRVMNCTVCNATRQEACSQCGRTGFHTTVAQVEFEIHTQFRVDENGLPGDLRAALEQIGPAALASGNHAEITRLEGQETEQAGVLQIPYTADIAFARAQFRLRGKNLKADICGKQGHIAKMPPFLDTLLKDGLIALSRAAKGQGNPHTLITRASQYRALRDVLLNISGQPVPRIAKKIYGMYRPAMSPKFAKTAAAYAKQALRQTTKRARIIGLALGLIPAAAIFYTVLHRDLRGALIGDTPAQNIEAISDFGFILLGWLACLYTIKFAARRARNRALVPALQKHGGRNAPKLSLPDAGGAGLLAILVVVILYVVFALTSPVPPFWTDYISF